MTQEVQTGAPWQPKGAGWEEIGGRFEREGIYVYFWLLHIVVQQKPIQHCKAMIVSLKIN